MVASIPPDLIFPSIFRKFDFDSLLSLQSVSACATILKYSPIRHQLKEWAVREDMDRIDLAQIWGLRRALVKTVLNLRVPQIFRNWLAEKCWFLFNLWGPTDTSPWLVQLGVIFFREVFKTVLNRPAIFSPYTVYLQLFSNSVAAYFICQGVTSSSSEFHFMMTVARYILMVWQMTAAWREIQFDTSVDQMF